MDHKPALRPQDAIGGSLRAVAGDILQEARAALDRAPTSEAVAVHDFRKAMKRWRAFLRLLQPFLGEDGLRLRLEARDLARILAATRDSQSALDALHDLGEDEPSLGPRSIAALKTRVVAIRQARESMVSITALAPRLREYLAAADQAISRWTIEPLEFAAIAGRLAETYRRARAAMPADWAQAGAEDLHALRRGVVEHRYQMELILPLWPRMGRLWIEETQRLRNRLGAHQDLAVLSAMTAARQPLARWRARLLPLVAARQSDHVHAAHRQAQRLFAERPKAFRRRLDALWESAAAH
jgi:CHAD domain-containing protein